MLKTVTFFLSIIAIFAVCFGCSSDEKGTLYIYCDEVLRPAVEKVVSEFQGESGYQIQLICDPEDRVFRRMKLSKHADLFISITPELIEQSLDLDMCIDDEKICGIMPVMITAPLNPLRIQSLSDLDEADLRIGVNNPDTTLGKMTRRLFEENGFDWEEVRQAIHYPSENEAALIETLQNSAIDVGLIWSMTALEAERIEYVTIDPDVNVNLSVVAMTLKKSEHPEAATDLVRFMKSPKMKEIWKKFGCGECNGSVEE